MEHSLLFEKNARVCFLGDSITRNGLFMAKVFDYYRTHFPERRVKMFNAGVPGDTAAGCVRMDRQHLIMEKFHPTEVVLMFGMNDVGRHLYTDANKHLHSTHLAAVQIGVRHTVNMMRIVEDLRHMGLPVTLCSATPYDEISDMPEPVLFGCNEAVYNLFQENKYALSRHELKSIIDFNAPMNALLKGLHEKGAPVLIDVDRVHPTALGHEVMARLFLAGQGIDIDLPTVDSIIDGSVMMPPLSPENAARREAEQFVRSLSFLDYCAVWGQETMTLEEKCSYWREHAEEFGKQGAFHLKTALEYPEKKPREAAKMAELLVLTDAMYQ